MSNDGGPAFPTETLVELTQVDTGEKTRIPGYHTGMSLRDYFAAKALGGLAQDINAIGASVRSVVGRPMSDEGFSSVSYAIIAHTAYAMADAMLIERAK